METLAEELPPPKKQYPEFSKPHSDDSSVVSGDDFKGWMREEDDLFDTQMTPDFSRMVIVLCTNGHAAADGAGFGGLTYHDYVPFVHVEINKMIGLLFANGISPKPTMELWFKTTTEHRLFGNDFIAAAMDKQMQDGKKVPGIRRWKHFRRFMCVYDFRVNANTKKEKNPLWKVQSLLTELNHQAKKMWLTGKWVSIDEQTLGFKGKSAIKICISYKREGNGFQCDAVYDRDKHSPSTSATGVSPYNSSFMSTVRTTSSLSSFRNATNTQCNSWGFLCELGTGYC